VEGLTSANLTGVTHQTPHHMQRSRNSCRTFRIAPYRSVHAKHGRECELTDASLRGSRGAAWRALARAIARRGRSVTPCLPACALSCRTWFPHKAGIPSLCNDKLGVRFVKANWMRLLAYTVCVCVCVGSAILEMYKFASMRARARDSLTRISLTFVGRRRFLWGYPFEIRHIGSFAERERERERERGETTPLDPDLELAWHRESAMPEYHCQI